MNVSTIQLVLFLVSLILAAVDLFRSKGQSLIGWAVVLTDAALILGNIR